MKVAVIGGGIAGLTCAIRLKQLGIQDVVVFDTGKHSVGGRCSSRVVSVSGQLCVFDHSVQYFTATDPRFKKVVSFLERDGAVKRWDGKVGKLKRGKFVPDPQLAGAYVGVDGMRSVAESLAKSCDVRRPSWVGYIEFDFDRRKWTVDKYGQFDYVVIAHNGKCAAKLTEHSGAPEIHKLCETRFSSQVNPRDKRMTLSSLFVLMVAFESTLGLSYEGAHVQDTNISWICNNSAKLRKKSAVFTSSKAECWTIISTTTLAEQNKVPQEHIPPNVEKRICGVMLESFFDATGLNSKNSKVCFQKLQLWGAAVPLNTLATSQECVFDGQRHIGICTDWLVSPCVQGAAISGLALAEAIGRSMRGEKSSTSLQPVFKAEPASSPIGHFP